VVLKEILIDSSLIVRRDGDKCLALKLGNTEPIMYEANGTYADVLFYLTSKPRPVLFQDVLEHIFSCTEISHADLKTDILEILREYESLNFLTFI
jgi:hypothetical protein